MSSLSPLLQSFFIDRLRRQHRASPKTVAAYRDCLKMLVAFAAERAAKEPVRLDLEDLDARVVSAFLDHLEQVRGNSVRTRNARLAAVRAFYRYAAFERPEAAELVQRVLAIPQKRFDKATISFLSPKEADALLAAPDKRTWTGRRDHAMLLVCLESGLRVSELTSLRVGDVVLSKPAYVHCQGKGRKARSTPATTATTAVLKAWVAERGGSPEAPLFPTRTGGHLGRSAVEHLVTKYAALASQRCPSVAHKNVTPHVLRHSAAMRLLEAGVDVTVIALWLGHEGVETTGIYLHADMSIKQRALDKTAPLNVAPGRYRPPDTLLAFLDGL
ncbi:MAG TPA: tyrosine-type recombinase/integrase [Acidimicrobiales bacterium]|nr:tyrosine-type recombinase/integrase [Acidimicrobiales bacterium]